MNEPVFTAEDIRQYYYCKRIIFHRYVLRVRVRETYKMKKGREKHNIHYIGNNYDQNSRILKNVYLFSESLGLVGMIDILVVNGDSAEIIELKMGDIGNSRMRDSHKAQLAAQAMLVEEVMGLRVHRISVMDIDTGESREVRLVNYHREMVTSALEEMRWIVLKEIFPDPPENRGKCVDCEYKSICGDL